MFTLVPSFPIYEWLLNQSLPLCDLILILRSCYNRVWEIHVSNLLCDNVLSVEGKDQRQLGAAHQKRKRYQPDLHCIADTWPAVLHILVSLIGLSRIRFTRRHKCARSPRKPDRTSVNVGPLMNHRDGSRLHAKMNAEHRCWLADGKSSLGRNCFLSSRCFLCWLNGRMIELWKVHCLIKNGKVKEAESGSGITNFSVNLDRFNYWFDLKWVDFFL